MSTLERVAWLTVDAGCIVGLSFAIGQVLCISLILICISFGLLLRPLIDAHFQRSKG